MEQEVNSALAGDGIAVEVKKALAKDGTEILEFQKQDKVYRMNSLYRPQAEAEKFAAPFAELEAGSVLMVFGYGNGIFPCEIMKACGADTTVIFYEPEQSVWEAVGNSKADVAKVMDTRGILVTGRQFGKGRQYGTITEFPALLEGMISYSNYKKVKCVSLPKYGEIFSEQFKEFEEMIHNQINKLHSSVATAKHMGHEAVMNNIMNLRYVLDSFCGDSFCDVFPKDLPAIVVSAGASLEKNVSFLKQAKNHALIVCVDSAAKYLLNQNIIPDFIVSVDPMKPLFLFEDSGIKEIPLVGSTDMNYRVLESVKSSRVIFASTDNTYVQKLYESAGHTIDLLKSGGSVATLAFSLCVYWGIQRIIFVGQDLAFAGEQMYAGREGKPGIEALRTYVEVPGIDGDMVWTNKPMYKYLKWFEQEIAQESSVKVIDATEGGARIEGTQIMTLREALESYAIKEYDVEKLVEDVSPTFDEKQREKIRDCLRESAHTLKELTRRLKKGIELSGKGMQLAQQGVKEVSRYENIDKEIQEICRFYDTLDEAFFIQREIDATHLEEFMGLFEHQEDCQGKQRYERLGKYFRLLLEAASSVEEVWEKLLG